MNAGAGTIRHSAPQAGEAAVTAASLSGLLLQRCRQDRRAPAFRDQAGREAWSGRPCLDWSRGDAQAYVRRLADFLLGLDLPPGSPVAVVLPASTEACLSILAIESAGLIACLIPLAWSEAALAEAITRVAPAAAITQARLAELRPAEIVRRVAAGRPQPRVVCAFGPQLPDSVVNLDRALPDAAPAPEQGLVPSRGVITFGRRSGRLRPLYRPTRSILGAAAAVLEAGPIGAANRMLTLLPPDDFAGLVLGPAIALATGAMLECHGLFDSLALAAALADGAEHLVAPGWIAPWLADTGLARLRAVALVHRWPLDGTTGPAWPIPVTDVTAVDETALWAARRSPGERISRANDPAGRGNPPLTITPDHDRPYGSGTAAEVYDWPLTGPDGDGASPAPRASASGPPWRMAARSGSSRRATNFDVPEFWYKPPMLRCSE